MSVEALSWVLNHYDGKGADRLVMVSLANHADADGTCWPGLARIAKQAGITEQHAKRVIRKLDADGTIERLVNQAPDMRIRNDRRPNCYVLTAFNNARRDARAGGTSEPPRGPTGGISDTDGGYIHASTGGIAGTPESSIEPSGESENHSVPSADAEGTVDYPPEFEALWREYPRKIAKRKAWKAWKVARRGRATDDQLAAAVANYAKATFGRDPAVIMHAATFLGPDRRWEDWIAPDPTELAPPTRGAAATDKRAERHRVGRDLDEALATGDAELLIRTMRGTTLDRRRSEPTDRHGLGPVAELGAGPGPDPHLAGRAG